MLLSATCVNTQVSALLFALLLLYHVVADPCQLCPNGESITLPDKTIEVPGFPSINDCGTLDALVGFVLTDNTSSDCIAIQSVSSICGCPVAEGGCRLCGNDNVTQPTRPVPYVFADMFESFVPTCELFEAFLSNVPEANTTCSLAQGILTDHCGCGLPPDAPQTPRCSLCPNGASVMLPNNTFDMIDDFPVQTCSDLEAATALLLPADSETCTLMNSFASYCGCPRPVGTPEPQPCELCMNGNITLPSKAITVPGIPFINDCASLDSLLGIFVAEGTSDCQLLQSLSTICGCPVPREGKCNLCGNSGAVVTKPDREVPILFQEQFGAFVPTCEFFEAFLLDLAESDGTCSLAQGILSEHCGCAVVGSDLPSLPPPATCFLCPDGGTASFPDRLLNIEGFPVQTCGELDTATSMFLSEGSETCNLLQSVGTYCGCPVPQDSCSLCRDGSDAPSQDTPLPAFEEQFGFIPTCGVLEAYVHSLGASSEECSSLQVLGSFCECPPVEDHCVFCEAGDMSRDPNTTLPELQEFIDDFDFSCYNVYFLQFQIPSNERLCIGAMDRSWVCGCNGGFFPYFGTASVSQQAGLAWTPRVSAFFSLLGSMWIIYDVGRDKQKHKSTFHQIVFAMSVIDVLSSIAWGLSTIPVPKYDEFGTPTNIYGASGNQATCTTQGFFVQLGYTSMFYNLTLSLYYALVIVKGWKESQLKKVRYLLHSPILFGSALAFAGIPFYKNDIWGCWIQPPPLASNYTKILIFGMIPISIVVLFATGAMISVYWKVRKDSRASNKWRRGGGKGMALERQVFWQAVFYLSAFYVSQPILLVSNSIAEKDYYWFWVLVMFLAPLQGFSNFLVYVRPRIVRHLKKKREERKKKRKQARTQSTQSTNDQSESSNRNSFSSILDVAKRISVFKRLSLKRNQITLALQKYGQGRRHSAGSLSLESTASKQKLEGAEPEFVLDARVFEHSGDDLFVEEEEKEEEGDDEEELELTMIKEENTKNQENTGSQ